MQWQRGICTSEFWAGALAVLAIMILAANGSRSEVAEGVPGIAMIATAYIVGRSAIKVVRELAGGRRTQPPR
jgi:hypothetical protein